MSRVDLEEKRDHTQPEASGGKTSPAVVVMSEIKARADKATPGPWRIVTIHHVPSGHPDFGKPDKLHKQLYDSDHETEPGGLPVYFSDDANADFIAHSRTDIPALLATVSAQAEELKRARAILVESVLAIGGHAEERTSLDFLAYLPEEIRARNKRHLDMVRAIDAATGASEVLRGSSNSKEKVPNEAP